MEDRIKSVQCILNGCSLVVREYAWLLDCYVLDYFVDDHWARLPKSWRFAFQNIDPTNLGEVLAGQPPKTILPLSFLALLKTVNSLSLGRQPIYSNKINNDLNKNENRVTVRKLCIKKMNKSESYSCSDHPRLKNLFLKHVKAKKRHEITRMCSIVRDRAHVTRCGSAIDVGSGVGHLVRSLAYQHDMYMAGIERDTQFVDEARKLDKELEYTAAKHLSAKNMEYLKRPRHLNLSVSFDTNFNMLNISDNLKEYGIVGLHPCGDLGPFLLRQFTNCDNVKFICIVGCCYMKLTCGTEKDCGYPMSEHMRGQPCELSYESREIACHAIETYTDRLRSGNYHDLQVHAYRAALEVILVRMDSRLKHTGIRSIKHMDTLSFERYCEKALERIGVEVTLTENESEEVQRNLSRWKHVVTFYTLRLMLAPVVETILLLDRVLYLLERGLVCDIRPVFDPRLSPRNHIIIGRK